MLWVLISPNVFPGAAVGVGGFKLASLGVFEFVVPFGAMLVTIITVGGCATLRSSRFIFLRSLFSNSNSR